jgi:hypothetical protein
VAHPIRDIVLIVLTRNELYMYSVDEEQHTLDTFVDVLAVCDGEDVDSVLIDICN